MAAYELLSDQGLRLDGRKSGELRRIRCKMGVFGQADGSAYIEQVSLSDIGLRTALFRLLLQFQIIVAQNKL